MPTLAFTRTLALTTILLVPSAALALELAVFVSGSGSDANNCFTPSSACGTLAGALGKVEPRGVIHVLPGRYSGTLIDKPVDLIADAGNASIAGTGVDCVGGTAGLCVAPPLATDVVRIRGFIIDHRSLGFLGIWVLRGEVHIEKCTLAERLDRSGLDVIGAGELHVSDSVISDGRPGGSGIVIMPTGSASVKFHIERTRIANNATGNSGRQLYWLWCHWEHFRDHQRQQRDRQSRDRHCCAFSRTERGGDALPRYVPGQQYRAECGGGERGHTGG